MKKGFPTESSPSPFNHEDSDIFFKVVRLKTGESIMCVMNSNVKSVAAEHHLALINPVLGVATKQMVKEEEVVMEFFNYRPWMGTCNSEEEFVIPTDIVLTIGDMNLTTKLTYEKYVEKVREAHEFVKYQQEQDEIHNAIVDLLNDVNGGTGVKIFQEPDDIPYIPYDKDDE